MTPRAEPIKSLLTMKTTFTVSVWIVLGFASANALPTLQAKRVLTAPGNGWSYFFGSCSWYCGSPGIKASASSFLTESATLKHPAGQAHDRSMEKVWSEGVAGHGIGESLSFVFHTTREDTDDLGVTSCAIGIGHQGSERLFGQNSRPKVMELIVDGRSKALLHLEDTMGLQQFEIPKVALARPSEHTITLKIREVFPGSKFEDTCISEIYFQGTGKMH